MRLFGHPIHVMLVHFPTALWPAHAAVHAFSSYLPDGSLLVAFWLLAAGTALAWLAMICGAVDLMNLALAPERPSFRLGLVHGAINGMVTVGFTVLLALENAVYPNIHHGRVFLLVELGLLILMFAGNFFGGAIVWSNQSRSPSKAP
jgi:uncharacterized membrane protein